MLKQPALPWSHLTSKSTCVCVCVSTPTHTLSLILTHRCRHTHEYFEQFFSFSFFFFFFQFQLQCTQENQTGLYSNRWLNEPRCCDKWRYAELIWPILTSVYFLIGSNNHFYSTLIPADKGSIKWDGRGLVGELIYPIFLLILQCFQQLYSRHRQFLHSCGSQKGFVTSVWP